MEKEKGKLESKNQNRRKII